MKNSNPNIYHIIGMSPGNGYFKDEEIQYLLKTVVERFGRVAVLIADIPAISTYVALGYPKNRARRDKAIPKGNALKNRVRKTMKVLGYSNDVVKILDWGKEIENNRGYRDTYKKISALYESNKKFRDTANSATRAVLVASKKDPKDMEKATTIAVHYVLSELAFLECAPSYLGAEKIIYVYHKNWEVYEEYIAGTFDDRVKTHLDFMIIKPSSNV